MTTKPKAKKFRIRRNTPADTSAGDAASETMANATPQTDDGPQPDASKGQNMSDPAGDVAHDDQTVGDTDLDSIRREGLTGRQLRMARRVAQKSGLAPTSDFDAVRLLRVKGIDPFQRSNMLELVVPQGGAEQHEGAAGDALRNLPAQPGGAGSGRVQLPQTMPGSHDPAVIPEMGMAERRALEISEIQRDITRRRRRKLMTLMVRLAFFVFMPTAIAGYYFYAVATPMYATKSEFLILKADNAGGSGLGGLLTGTQFATAQDSIATQSYLQSKDAMLRLDRDVGFKSHFTQDWIDPIQRLDTDPSNEEAYKTFKKNVKVGYDPTEGSLRMEVIAADPQVSARFSEELIGYAEDRINRLSEQKRDDQMADAQAGFTNGEQKRRGAQEQLVNLQIQGATLDPEAVIAGIRGQINSVELQVQEKELQLSALLDNTRPNQSRVDGAKADIRRLSTLLQQLKDRMTDASRGENSLAQLTVRIQMAQADLATRDLLLSSALQQMEQTRSEANRQVRYLTTSVQPVASEDPSYPRKFENTILAFLIFSGVYLLFSLTASILREQVTS